MSTGSSPDDEAPRDTSASLDSERPDWADGLRQLYNSVVDEPLPDSFKDLLDRLDEASPQSDSETDNGSGGNEG